MQCIASIFTGADWWRMGNGELGLCSESFPMLKLIYVLRSVVFYGFAPPGLAVRMPCSY